MKHALLYSLKVWLTAATVTPILAYLVWSVFSTIFGQDDNLNYGTSASSFLNISGSTATFKIANVSLDLFQSTLYSIPYWLVLFAAAFSLSKQTISVAYKKSALTFISILLTITPFTFLEVVDEDAFNKLQSGIVAFEAVIISGIWFYHLMPFPSKMYHAIR